MHILKWKWISSFSLGLLLSASAIAGGMDPGGGYGFVCFAQEEQAAEIVDREYKLEEGDIDSIVNIKPVDLVMAEKLAEAGQTELMEPMEGESYYRFMNRVLVQIGKHSTHLEEEMRLALDTLALDSRWKYAELPRPEDIGDLFLSTRGITEIGGNHCVAMPLAIQYLENGNYVLSLDGRLMGHGKVSEVGKAVLWLHEALYFVLRKEKGHVTSYSTITALSYLLQKDGTFSPEKMQEVLSTLDIKM